MNDLVIEYTRKVKDLLGPALVKQIATTCSEAESNLKILLRKELRPWGDFFLGMTVSQPWDRKNAEFRMCSNLLHYRSNYFLISVAVLLLGLLLNPIIVLSLLVVIAWYIYVMLILKGPFMVGEFELDWRMRFVICSITAGVFFTLTGALESLVLSVLFGGALCLCHMVLKDPSPHLGGKITLTPAHRDFRLALFTALGANESEFFQHMTGGDHGQQGPGQAQHGQARRHGSEETDAESGNGAAVARRKSAPGVVI